MLLYVSMKDQREGEHGLMNFCPIALAMKRTLGCNDVAVSKVDASSYIRTEDDPSTFQRHRNWKLSKRAQRFVRRFDYGWIRPFPRVFWLKEVKV